MVKRRYTKEEVEEFLIEELFSELGEEEIYSAS